MSKHLSISLLTLLVMLLSVAVAQPILEPSVNHGEKVDDASSGQTPATTTTTEANVTTKTTTTSSNYETAAADSTESAAEPTETENVRSGMGFEQIFNSTQTRLKRKYSTKLYRRKPELKSLPVSYIAPQPEHEIKRNPLIQHIVHLLNLSEKKYLDNLMKMILQEDQKAYRKYPANTHDKLVAVSAGTSKQPKQSYYSLEPEYKYGKQVEEQIAAHPSILPLLNDDMLDYDSLINNGGPAKLLGNLETEDERVAALAAATSNENLFQNAHEHKNYYDQKMFFEDPNEDDNDNLDQKTLMELLQYIK